MPSYGQAYGLGAQCFTTTILPAHEILVQMCRLARALAARLHKVGT